LFDDPSRTDAGQPGEPQALLEVDARAHPDALLRLAALASVAHDRFAFSDETAAGRFYAELYRRGGADFAPPFGRLFLIDGRPAALVALVPPAAHRRSRLIGAVMLARSPQLRDDPPLARRLRLAASAFVQPLETDAYLSRMAVDPSMSGRGVGGMLLREALRETARQGLVRCVLEVADTNSRAIALYRRSGFDEIGRAAVTDPETSARLGYLHLARAV
jgi:ribosomal protein S18 acetylase RimI-like enzyme